LSNSAETKPNPKVESHEASGKFSTGISEADVTRATRNTAPLDASGIADQSGDLIPAKTKMMSQMATPRTGTALRKGVSAKLRALFAARAAIRIDATINSRTQSMVDTLQISFTIDECLCCTRDAGTAKTAKATMAGR